MRRGRDLWSDPELDGTEFADECEAFLAGRWADVREDSERALPMWAWLNPLAHGSLEQVRAIAATADPSQGAERLQVTVAQAVLSAVPASALAEVQHDVLVPLELRLMSSPATPRHVLELVTDALY